MLQDLPDENSCLWVLTVSLPVCAAQPALRGGALNTIKAREPVTNGPLNLVMGNFGTIARIPIFIQNSTLNDTFGTNKTCECMGSL